MNRRLIKRGIVGILALFLVWNAVNGYAQILKRTTLEVSNLSCGYCLSRIDAKLSGFQAYAGMNADLRQGVVVVDHQASLEGEAIASAITELGYPAKAVSTRDISKDPDSISNQRKSAYSCCGGGSAKYSGCPVSATAWKRLLNIRSEKQAD